jgi:hypothetical protein
LASRLAFKSIVLDDFFHIFQLIHGPSELLLLVELLFGLESVTNFAADLGSGSTNDFAVSGTTIRVELTFAVGSQAFLNRARKD